MSFNPDPSKQAVEVLFSTKNNEPEHPPLLFNGNRVLKSQSHKHLGLTIDSKLYFSSHIQEKIKKSRKLIDTLKYLNNYLPLKTLSQIYKMFIRPHLDYGDIIFHIPHTYNIFDSTITLHPLMEKIENI